MDFPEAGALAAHLHAFGESPCRITLAVEDLAASRGYLDQHEVTYKYLEQAHHPVLWIHPHQACGAAIVLHQEVVG